MYPIKLPVEDGGLVKDVLAGLAEWFDRDGAKVDRKVHNPARLTKLYGTIGRKGPDTPERPHRSALVLSSPQQLVPVPIELLRTASVKRVAVSASTPDARTVPKLSVTSAGAISASPGIDVGWKTAAARSYIAKVPAAVSGQGGDRRTYTVCMYLAVDFDLPPASAWPLLVEYNARCTPPWDEADLRRKLDYAYKKLDEDEETMKRRGQLLRRLATTPAAGPGLPPEPPAGPAFPVAVPDFILWDVDRIRPYSAPECRDKRGRKCRPGWVTAEWIRDLCRFALFTQGRARVVLPDEVLGSILWGPRTRVGGWPSNWRRTIYQNRCKIRTTVRTVCSEHCPLFGRTARPHGHLGYVMTDEFLGRMGDFRTSADLVPTTTFDFRNRLSRHEVEAGKAELKVESREREDWLPNMHHSERDEARAELDRAKERLRSLRVGSRKVTGVRPVYLLVRLFGPSPRSGLTPLQCNLLSALTAELTRAQRSRRPDRAQVVVAGQPIVPPEPHVPQCPYLPAGVGHVLFNGNGSGLNAWRHGNGYFVKSWLRKAGYPADATATDLLKDLAALTSPFGLVVGGWHKTKREWRTLDEMLALRKTTGGGKWLGGCMIRVYTPATYLSNWRSFFAKQLGFATIPGGGPVPSGDAGCETGPAVAVTSGPELAAWLMRNGLTDGQLAEALGVNRSTVNLYKTGRREWSGKFQSLLEKYLGSTRCNTCSPDLPQM